MSATRSYPSKNGPRGHGPLSSDSRITAATGPHGGERPTLKRRLSQVIDELVSQGVPLAQARQEFERQFIVASIESNDGNLGRSARSLGVHRNTLRNKVSSLGIDTAGPPGPRSPRRALRRPSDDT